MVFSYVMTSWNNLINNLIKDGYVWCRMFLPMIKKIESGINISITTYFLYASCTSLSLSITVHMFHTQLFPVHYSGCALCTSLFTVQLQYSGCASCTSLFTLQLQYSGCASCTSLFTVQLQYSGCACAHLDFHCKITIQWMCFLHIFFHCTLHYLSFYWPVIHVARYWCIIFITSPSLWSWCFLWF